MTFRENSRPCQSVNLLHTLIVTVNQLRIPSSHYKNATAVIFPAIYPHCV
jgi:hypothetical protein